jgi:23S rRNA (uracil1939-C5)-methyltransferase
MRLAGCAGLAPRGRVRAGAAATPVPIVIDCPHAERCPGCAWIGLPQAEQLARKASRLEAALAPYAQDAHPNPEAVRGAPSDEAYRTRAKLAVAAGGHLGLYAAGSHEVVDLPGCRVLVPVLSSAANALRGLLSAPPADAGAVLCAGEAGRLRAVDLREVRDGGEAGVLLTLVVVAPRPGPHELDAACDALEKAIPALRAVALSLHDGRSPQLLGRAPVALRGEPLQPDRVAADAPFHLASPGSFAQAHRGQAAAIQCALLEALAPRPGRRLLDAFAGSGSLALALAARGADVTLVESFAPAAEAALLAAERQDLATRLHVCVGTAEQELPRLRDAGTRFDGAVANPPRRGLAPAAREALAGLVTGTLAYVSCEPETLARDLSHLRQLGWRCVRLVPFDLMPQTREVECVALCEPGEAPLPPLLYEDEELLAVAKPAFLSTVPHPERRDSLLARVRAAFAGEAVALHRLDADTSGVCLFARRGSLAADWQAALSAATATKRYLALVRGGARASGRIARSLVEEGRERAAVTRYRRLERLAGHALLEVTPESGRTHQIRRHLAGIGAPVLGDERHGHAPSNRHFAERHWLDRPFLHCESITLVHPRRGEPLRIEAPLAPDLAAVLTRLRASDAQRSEAPRPPTTARTAAAPRAKSRGRRRSDRTR